MTGFRLIDRLVALERGTRAVAVKTFGGGDEIFRDHFPGNPLVPGSLLIEAMAQTAGWLVVATTSFGKAAQLVMVKDAKFRRAVRPDIQITVSATIASARGATYELKADARTDGQLAASAVLVLRTIDIEASDRTAAFTAWARNTFRAIGGEGLGPGA